MPIAAIIITAALIFYSIGVWSEKFSFRLKLWHVIFFLSGLICDTIGTSMMFGIYKSLPIRDSMPLHKISGIAAIILMFFHALWAVIVLLKNNEKQLKRFHNVSFIVWLIWLIPYLSGVFLGMNILNP